MKEIKNILGLLALGALMTACSSIGEDERFIYVKPESPQRCVLVEDYTGQLCINCPKATGVIDQLQEAYGENIIAVGIHCGLSLPSNAETMYMGLGTTEGEEYYRNVGQPSQPAGRINRTGSPITIDQWTEQVNKVISQNAPLALDIEAQYNMDTRQISVTTQAMGSDGATTGKLQLWIVEDGIVAPQLLPDGSSQTDYVHNHVFRGSVNGTWGEDFSIVEGEQKQSSHTATLPEYCNAENVSIVAFVYNDKGVQQAAIKKIIDKR